MCSAVLFSSAAVHSAPGPTDDTAREQHIQRAQMGVGGSKWTSVDGRVWAEIGGCVWARIGGLVSMYA